MKKPSFFSYEHPSYPAHITINVILTTFLAIVSSVTTMIGDSAIQGELALSDTEAIWLTTLYLLGANTAVPTANWFANRFGFNRVYTWGVLIFTISTLFAGLATNFFMIGSARFIEGIGAGFIFPIGLALIAKSMSKDKFDLAVNLYIGIAFGAGLGMGIILAGYFSQFYSWRYIFFLLVPFGILTTISCWFSRKKVPDLHITPFDFFGFVTFVVFFSTLLIALTLGPIRATPQGWETPYIVVFFILSFISFIAFVIIEKNHSHPLFPLPLFKDSIFSVSVIAIFLLGMSVFASVSVSIQYMLNGLFYERFSAGKIASVYGFTIGVSSMVANGLTKILPVPVLTFSGLFLLGFSFFYNNELSWLTGYTQVIAILFIRGIGIGLALGPTTLLALRDISDELKPTGATALTFFRQIGGTYGGTLISIFSIRRTIFHAARFGEQANTQLPAYKYTFQNLMNKYPDPVQAKEAIVKNILTQAEIQGINDALFMFGYVTLALFIILLTLFIFRYLKSRNRSLQN
jgi:DHA2 family multidrug resistance protein